MLCLRGILVLSGLLIAGCADAPSKPEPKELAAADSQSTPPESGKTARSNTQTLADGLSTNERDRFNHLSMGSELIPLEWLRVLRSHKTGQPFLEQIERFGLIEDPRDPNGLPLGLTAAPSVELKGVGLMVGFNCAACHTGQIRYQDQTVVITGGQSMFDVTAFTGELFASMAATAKEPRELLAFVNRLWKARPQKSTEDPEVSRHRLALLAHLEAADGAARKGIEQKVQFLIEEANRQETVPAVSNSTNSHPLGDLLQGFDQARHAILDSSQKIEWPLERLSPSHGIQAVHDFSQEMYVSARLLRGRGAMARQIVELKHRALGQTAGGPGRVDDFNAGRNLLFPAEEAVAMTSPCSIPPLWGLVPGQWTDWDGNTTSALGRSMLTALAGGAVFDPKTRLSSVSPQNLLELEQLSQRIQSPSWPEAVLGVLDKNRIARGQTLFDKNCRSCHRPSTTENAAPQSEAVVSWKELGTDPLRIQNFAKPVAGRPLALALEEVSKQYLEKACESADFDRKDFDEMQRTHPNRWQQTDGYVARSLSGIWATAPYLHNGSVPTLADLLLPPEERPSQFWIGAGEFDRERVGLQSIEGKGFHFETTLPGNGNIGHLYGTEFSTNEKRDLVEFLKSL